MHKAMRQFDRSMAGVLIFAARMGCLCFFAISLIPAQATPLPQEHAETSRPLTAREGRAIIRAAREHQQQVRGKPDCSHLVHQVYRLAGFEYPYATSFDLYAGTGNFMRVKTPQPGDLTVWPGHVGIVLDTVQHTFYSSVRSGMHAEFYDGPYWRARGKPRFYRYAVATPAKVKMARARVPSRAPGTSGERVNGTVKDEETDAPGAASKQPTKGNGEGAARDVNASRADAGASLTEVPASVLIAAGNRKPAKEEAAEGISELSSAAGNVLRVEHPLKPKLPVVIFDQLDVARVEIKRDHGWAHVRIHSRVSITSDRATVKARHEKVRWELRRTEAGWEAVLPADRAYVPRDVAVRALAARLAQLTQTEGAANHEGEVVREEGQLASLLNTLLQNK